MKYIQKRSFAYYIGLAYQLVYIISLEGRWVKWKVGTYKKG
jgi:hypothetical protein